MDMSALFGPILRPGAYRQECVETYDESDPHAVPAVATDPVTWGDLEDPVFRKGRVGKCYNASTVRGIMDKNNRVRNCSTVSTFLPVSSQN